MNQERMVPNNTNSDEMDYDVSIIANPIPVILFENPAPTTSSAITGPSVITSEMVLTSEADTCASISSISRDVNLTNSTGNVANQESTITTVDTTRSAPVQSPIGCQGMECDISFSLDPVPSAASAFQPSQPMTSSLAIEETSDVNAGTSESAITIPSASTTQTALGSSSDSLASISSIERDLNLCTLNAAGSTETECDVSLNLDSVPVADTPYQLLKSCTITSAAQKKHDSSDSTIVDPSANTTQVDLTSDADTYASVSSITSDKKSNFKGEVSSHTASSGSREIALDMASEPFAGTSSQSSKSVPNTCAAEYAKNNESSQGRDSSQTEWKLGNNNDSFVVLEPALYNQILLCRKRFQEYVDEQIAASNRDAANQSRIGKIQYFMSQERKKKGPFVILRYNFLYRRKERALLNSPITRYVDNSDSSENSSGTKSTDVKSVHEKPQDTVITHENNDANRGFYGAGTRASTSTGSSQERNLDSQPYRCSHNSADGESAHERPSRTRSTQNCPNIRCSSTMGIPESYFQSRNSTSADRASTSTGISHECDASTRRSYDEYVRRNTTSVHEHNTRTELMHNYHNPYGIRDWFVEGRLCGSADRPSTSTGICHERNPYAQEFGSVPVLRPRTGLIANYPNLYCGAPPSGHIPNYPNPYYGHRVPDWFIQSRFPGSADPASNRIISELPGHVENYSNPYYGAHPYRVPDWFIQGTFPSPGCMHNYPNAYEIPHWFIESRYPAVADSASIESSLSTRKPYDRVDRSSTCTDISHERNAPTRRSCDADVRDGASTSISHERTTPTRRSSDADVRGGSSTGISRGSNVAATATGRDTGSSEAKSDIVVINKDDDNDDDVMIIEEKSHTSIWWQREIIDLCKEEEETEVEKEAEEGTKAEGAGENEGQEEVDVIIYEYEDDCEIWSIQPTRHVDDDFEWQEIDNEIFYVGFEHMVRTHLSERLLWFDDSIDMAPALRDRLFGRHNDSNTHLQEFFEKLLNYVMERRGLSTVEWRYFFKRCFDWLKVIKICYNFPLKYNKIIAYWFARFLVQYAVHKVLCSDDNFIIGEAVISQMHSLLNDDFRAVGLTLLHMEMYRDLAIPLYRSIVNEFFMHHLSEWDVELYVIVVLCIVKWASFQRPSRVMADINRPEFLNLPSHVPPSSLRDAEYGPVFGLPNLSMFRTRTLLEHQLYVPEALRTFFQIYLETVGQENPGDDSLKAPRRDSDRINEQISPVDCGAEKEKELERSRKRRQNLEKFPYETMPSTQSTSTHLTRESDTKRAKISTASCNNRQQKSVVCKKNSDSNLRKKSNGENSMDIIDVDSIQDNIETSQAHKPKKDSGKSHTAHKVGNLRKCSLGSGNLNDNIFSASNDISVICNNINISKNNKNRTLESLYRRSRTASDNDIYLESLYEMLDTYAPSNKERNKTSGSSNSSNNKDQNSKSNNRTLTSLYGVKLVDNVQTSGGQQVLNTLRRSNSGECNSDSKKNESGQVINEASGPLSEVRSNTLAPHGGVKLNSKRSLDFLRRARKSNLRENSIFQTNNTTLRHLYGREFLSGIRQSKTQNSQKRSYREICTVVLESSSDEESAVEEQPPSPKKLPNIPAAASAMSAKSTVNSDCQKKVLSIPEQCRSIIESMATKPTRKEKHCIQGEVSSTTSHDNVDHITPTPGSEFLEVHSTDAYQNARVVGTVNVVEQPNSSFQSVSETLAPGRVLLGIDYSDDDDEDDGMNNGDFLSSGYWKVIEEATSSTEITHKIQSSEVVVLSTVVKSAARPSTADSVVRAITSFPENIATCSNLMTNTNVEQSNSPSSPTKKETKSNKPVVPVEGAKISSDNCESPSDVVQCKSPSEPSCSNLCKLRTQLREDDSKKEIGTSALKELSNNVIVSKEGEIANENVNPSLTIQRECSTVASHTEGGITQKNSESAHNATTNRANDDAAEGGTFRSGEELGKRNSAMSQSCGPVDAESDETAEIEKMLADIDENLRKASEIDIKHKTDVKSVDMSIGSHSFDDGSTNEIGNFVIADFSSVGDKINHFSSEQADDSASCKIAENVETLNDTVDNADDTICENELKQTTIETPSSEKEPEPSSHRNHSEEVTENSINASECSDLSITKTSSSPSLSAPAPEESGVKSITLANKHFELEAASSNINESRTCLEKSKVAILSVEDLFSKCELNKVTDADISTEIKIEKNVEEESLKIVDKFVGETAVALDNATNVVGILKVQEEVSMGSAEAIIEPNIEFEKSDNFTSSNEKTQQNNYLDGTSKMASDHCEIDQQRMHVDDTILNTGNTDSKHDILASASDETPVESEDTLLLQSGSLNITQVKEIPDEHSIEDNGIGNTGLIIEETDLHEDVEDSDTLTSDNNNVGNESPSNAIENVVQKEANLESPKSVSNSTMSQTDKIEEFVKDITLNSEKTDSQHNISQPDFSEISIDSRANDLSDMPTSTQGKELSGKHNSKQDVDNNSDLRKSGPALKSQEIEDEGAEGNESPIDEPIKSIGSSTFSNQSQIDKTEKFVEGITLNSNNTESDTNEPSVLPETLALQSHISNFTQEKELSTKPCNKEDLGNNNDRQSENDLDETSVTKSQCEINPEESGEIELLAPLHKNKGEENASHLTVIENMVQPLANLESPAIPSSSTCFSHSQTQDNKPVEDITLNSENTDSQPHISQPYSSEMSIESEAHVLSDIPNSIEEKELPAEHCSKENMDNTSNPLSEKVKHKFTSEKSSPEIWDQEGLASDYKEVGVENGSITKDLEDTIQALANLELTTGKSISTFSNHSQTEKDEKYVGGISSISFSKEVSIDSGEIVKTDTLPLQPDIPNVTQDKEVLDEQCSVVDNNSDLLSESNILENSLEKIECKEIEVEGVLASAEANEIKNTVNRLADTFSIQSQTAEKVEILSDSTLNTEIADNTQLISNLNTNDLQTDLRSETSIPNKHCSQKDETISSDRHEVCESGTEEDISETGSEQLKDEGVLATEDEKVGLSKTDNTAKLEDDATFNIQNSDSQNNSSQPDSHEIGSGHSGVTSLLQSDIPNVTEEPKILTEHCLKDVNSKSDRLSENDKHESDVEKELCEQSSAEIEDGPLTAKDNRIEKDNNSTLNETRISISDDLESPVRVTDSNSCNTCPDDKCVVKPDSKQNLSESDSNEIATHSKDTLLSQPDISSISQDAEICSTSPEDIDHETVTAAYNKCEKADKSLLKKADKSEQQLADVSPSVNESSSKPSITDKVEKHVQDTAINSENTDSTQHISQPDSDDVSTDSKAHAIPAALSPQADIPIVGDHKLSDDNGVVEHKLSDDNSREEIVTNNDEVLQESSPIKSVGSGNDEVGNEDLLDKPQFTKTQPIDETCVVKKSDSTSSNNAELQINDALLERKDLILTDDSRECIVAQKDEPISSCSNSTKDQSNHIRDNECVSHKVLSVEDVEKRTPWKMRIKRRISQCSDINKEFNIESDEEVKNDAPETTILNASADETVHELAFDIAKLDISKSKKVLGSDATNESDVASTSWFKKSKPSFSVDDSDTPNIVRDDSSQSLQTVNMSNVDKPTSSKTSTCTDLCEGQNTSSEQTNKEVNEGDSLNMPCNYNSEEILVVTTLINMRNKYANTSQVSAKSSADPITEAKDVDGELESKTEELVPTKIVEPVVPKSMLKNGNRADSTKKQVRFDEDNLHELKIDKRNEVKSASKFCNKLKTFRSAEGALLKGGNRIIKKKLSEINAKFFSELNLPSGTESKEKFACEVKRRSLRNKSHHIERNLPTDKEAPKCNENSEKHPLHSVGLAPRTAKSTDHRTNAQNPTDATVIDSETATNNTKVTKEVAIDVTNVECTSSDVDKTEHDPSKCVRKIDIGGAKVKIKIKKPEPKRALKRDRQTTALVASCNNIKQQQQQQMKKAVVMVKRLKLDETISATSNKSNSAAIKPCEIEIKTEPAEEEGQLPAPAPTSASVPCESADVKQEIENPAYCEPLVNSCQYYYNSNNLRHSKEIILKPTDVILTEDIINEQAKALCYVESQRAKVRRPAFVRETQSSDSCNIKSNVVKQVDAAQDHSDSTITERPESEKPPTTVSHELALKATTPTSTDEPKENIAAKEPETNSEDIYSDADDITNTITKGVIADLKKKNIAAKEPETNSEDIDSVADDITNTITKGVIADLKKKNIAVKEPETNSEDIDSVADDITNKITKGVIADLKKKNIAAKEPETNSEDIDSVADDITNTITKGVIADLKMLSPENIFVQSPPNTESIKNQEKPADCGKQQKCVEERTTAQLLDSSIEMVLGNSGFAKLDASCTKPQPEGTVAVNADSKLNTSDTEGEKKTSPLKCRLDILTAEKINNSIEKILEHKSNFGKNIESERCAETSLCSNLGIQGGDSERDASFMCSKLDEDISKKAVKKSLNDVKVISANVPEALFADDESENSNSDEGKDVDKFFAPILCLEPINELPNKSCADKDAETESLHENGNRKNLGTPTFTIETEVRDTTPQCDKVLDSLSSEEKMNETPKDSAVPKSDAEELNANLEVTESSFSLPAIADISAIDIPNDLSIANDYPDLLDAMLFEQVRQSMDCMISGTNSAKKWSQDSFTPSNGPSHSQAEVSSRIENSTDIAVGVAENCADTSETKEITLNEDALGIGQDSFLGTLSPLDEVEVSTTTGFDLVGSFTMEDFLADGSGDFFAFSELDKTQSRSNSFSSDAAVGTPSPSADVAGVDGDERIMEISQAVACDHSYNKYFTTVEQPENRKLPVVKSPPVTPPKIRSPKKPAAESKIFTKSKCRPKPFWKVRKNDSMETSTPKKNDEKTFDEVQIGTLNTCSSSGEEKKDAVSKDGVKGDLFYNMPVLETNSPLTDAKAKVEVTANQLIAAKNTDSADAVKPATEDSIGDRILEVSNVTETGVVSMPTPHISIGDRILKISNVTKTGVVSMPTPHISVGDRILEKSNVTETGVVSMPTPHISVGDRILEKSNVTETGVVSMPTPHISVGDRILEKSNVTETGVVSMPTPHISVGDRILEKSNVTETGVVSMPTPHISVAERILEKSNVTETGVVSMPTPHISIGDRILEISNVTETGVVSMPTPHISVGDRILEKSNVSETEDVSMPTPHISIPVSDVSKCNLTEDIKCKRQNVSPVEECVRKGPAIEITEVITIPPPIITQPIIRIQSQTNRLERIDPEPIIVQQNYLDTASESENELIDIQRACDTSETFRDTTRGSTPTLDERMKDDEEELGPGSPSIENENLSNGLLKICPKRPLTPLADAPPPKKHCSEDEVKAPSSNSIFDVLQQEESLQKKFITTETDASETVAPNCNETVTSSQLQCSKKNQDETSHNTGSIKRDNLKKNSPSIRLSTETVIGNAPVRCDKLGENSKPCHKPIRQSVPSSVESTRAVDTSVAETANLGNKIDTNFSAQALPKTSPTIAKVKCVETLGNTKAKVSSLNTPSTSSTDAGTFTPPSTSTDQSSQIIQCKSNVVVLQSSPAQSYKTKQTTEVAAETKLNDNVKSRSSCEVSSQKNQDETSHNTGSIKRDNPKKNSPSIRLSTETVIGNAPVRCDKLGENSKRCHQPIRQSVPSSVESTRAVDTSVTSSKTESLAQHSSRTSLKPPLGKDLKSLGHTLGKPSPQAKSVLGVTETPLIKKESFTPSPLCSPISPSVRHNVARTSPASALSGKNRVHPYQKFTSTPTNYKNKYLYQRDTVPSTADSSHTRISTQSSHTHISTQSSHTHISTQSSHKHISTQSSHTHISTQSSHKHISTQSSHKHISTQRTDTAKAMKTAPPVNAKPAAGPNISSIKLSASDNAMIASKLESYRGTLPEAKTYKEHRENQRLIKLQEEKLKLEFLEREKRRQAHILLAEAQRMKRKSHAESHEDHYKKFSGPSVSTPATNRYANQHFQQNQRYKQREKYVNKFSEIEKQVKTVGSEKFNATKGAQRNYVGSVVSAPLTTSTAWEPKSASVDEIIEHLTKLRKS